MGFHFGSWLKHKFHRISHKVKKTFHKATHWVRKKSKHVYDKIKDVAKKAYHKVIVPVGKHIIKDIELIEKLAREGVKTTTKGVTALGDVVEGVGETFKNMNLIIFGALGVGAYILLK